MNRPFLSTPPPLAAEFERNRSSLHISQLLVKADAYATHARTLLTNALWSGKHKFYEQVLEITSEVLAEIPFHGNAATCRGAALYHLGQSRDAEFILDLVVKNGNATPETYKYHGLAALELVSQGYKHYSKAASRAFHKIEQLEEHRLFAHTKLATLYTLTEDLDRADEQYMYAINCEDSDYTSVIDYADFLMDREDYARADYYLQNVYQGARKDAPLVAIQALDRLRMIHMLHNDPKGADECADEMLNLARNQQGKEIEVNAILNQIFRLKEKSLGWMPGLE